MSPLSLRRALGITKDFFEALRELPGDYLTPCGKSGNPDAWSRPKTKRQFENSSSRCFAECPIREACEAQGRSSKETGIYGGRYLVDGRETSNLPFGTRTSAAEKAAVKEEERRDVENIAKDLEDVWRQMAAESGLAFRLGPDRQRQRQSQRAS